MKLVFSRKNEKEISCSTNEEFQFDRFEVVFQNRIAKHLFFYSFDIATEVAPASVEYSFTIQSGHYIETVDNASIFVVNTNEFNRVSGFFEYEPKDTTCDIVLKYKPKEMSFVSIKNLRVIGFEL